MRHRIVALGGTLSIDRAPGGGTEVRAIMPNQQPSLAPA
jgi:signal transduction histidine kinase